MHTQVIHAAAVGSGTDADQLDGLVVAALGILETRLDQLDGNWTTGEVAFTIAASDHRTRVVAWCNVKLCV